MYFVEIQGIYIYPLGTSGVVGFHGLALPRVGLWDGRLCEKRFPQVLRQGSCVISRLTLEFWLVSTYPLWVVGVILPQI